MFKVIGSGLVFAIGAGAFYYWWSHNHGDLEDEFKHMGEHFKDTGDKVKDHM
jgi:hypothetical protein